MLEGKYPRAAFRASAGAILLSACAMAATLSSTPGVTFTKDVAPILQEKCAECHHPGTAAPMSLETYQETRPWARAIKERVVTRNMPPWHIDKTVGIQHFANDRSMSDAQIATIVKWVDAGAPMGDPKDMPAAKQWPTDNGWQTAKILDRPPDFVVRTDDFQIPAHGQDTWIKPVTALPVTEERWVRAVEIRPGTLPGRRVIHHARADLEQDDPELRAVAANYGGGIGPSGILMEWAVGKQNDVYREGAGKKLVPGADVRWDIHTHSVGEAIKDHVELAVWLYPKGVVPTHKTTLVAFQGMPRGSMNLDIPPNSIGQTSNITVLKQAARLENYQPHMHLRGKAMLMEAILPDGTTQTLSYVNNFNFNWMNNYIYTDDAAPVLPKGTMIRITAWYDNTKANRHNPDPDQWVGYGDRTVDEMSHAWVNVTYLSDEEYKQVVAKRQASASTAAAAH